MADLRVWPRLFSRTVKDVSPRGVYRFMGWTVRFEGILSLLIAFLVFSDFLTFFVVKNQVLDLHHQEKRIRRSILDLHSVSSSLFMMVQNGITPMTNANEALFRGYRIQAVVAFSDAMAVSRPVRGAVDRRTLRAIGALLESSRLETLSPPLRRAPPGTPFIPKAYSSRMFSLTQGQIRWLERRHMEIKREISHHTKNRNILLVGSWISLVFLIAMLLFLKRQTAQMVETMKFEMDLVKTLIVTSDVVRDWESFLRELLGKINGVMAVPFFFALFETKEGVYEVTVCWREEPEAANRKSVETVIGARLAGSLDRPGYPPLHFLHLVSDSRSILPEMALESIDQQTRSLFLETPRIGGIAGVGIPIGDGQNPLRLLVIKSFLSSFLNMIGSVKAIYLYNKEIEFFAIRDPLTRLFNQRVFWDLLDYEIGRSDRHEASCSLCVIDLDDFKTVNDTYGHMTGDEFLKGIARTIEDEVRQGDILCRYGGDEFTIIFPETDLVRVVAVVERIRQAVGGFVLDDPGTGEPIVASISIGVASYPDHGKNAQDLFHIADHTMYLAKRAGKNSYAVPSEKAIMDAYQSSSDGESRMLRLIRDNRVVPFFQPIVDLSTGEIKAVEVLGRMILENGEILSSGDFIELAERSGLVTNMDFSIFDKAIRSVLDQGFPGQLFLNLSPRSIIVNDFMSRLDELVGKTGISPDRIVFEITERESVRNYSLLEGFLRELRGRGFSFAIDDFGAGYSSHHYLRAFPVSFLKVDGPFITGAGKGNAVDVAIVKSIVTMGDSLGLTTIAENVEDEACRSMALSMGIRWGQGYFLGRPVADLPKEHRPDRSA